MLPRLRKQLGNPHSCPEELFPKLLPIYGQFPNQDIIGHADLLLEDLKGVIECIPAHQENHRSATMAMAGSSKKRAAITAFFETALLILSKLSETASAAAPVEPNCHNKVCGHVSSLVMSLLVIDGDIHSVGGRCQCHPCNAMTWHAKAGNCISLSFWIPHLSRHKMSSNNWTICWTRKKSCCFPNIIGVNFGRP